MNEQNTPVTSESTRSAPASTETPQAQLSPEQKVKEAFKAQLAASQNPPAPDNTATVNADSNSLKEMTRLARQKRELAEQVKKQEAQLSEAQVLIEAKKLYSEGKYAEAIAKLSGKSDSVDALDDLITNHFNKVLEEPSQESEFERKLTDLESKVTKSEEDKQKQKLQEQANAFVQFIDSAVFQPNQEKFELCMKTENRNEAITVANRMVAELIKDNPELNTEDPDKAAQLYATVFEEIEANYEDIGRRRYTKTNTEQTRENRLSSEQHKPVTTNRQQPEPRKPTSGSLPKPGIQQELPKKYPSIDDAIAKTRKAMLDSMNK